MTSLEKFYIRILAVGMGLVVLLILVIIGFVVYRTLDEIKTSEREDEKAKQRASLKS